MNTLIRITGARQNNLKNLDLTIQTGQLLVITGVSGSGKSSLAFDTLYAEGQRRYVETFSPYARQFLDRMDKPQVDRIEGILPAIAIDQVNPVRNSRSTVGTMTELNDHLKLLFARAAHLHCAQCARQVVRDNPASIRQQIDEWCAGHNPRLIITFPLQVPANFTVNEIRGYLEQQGYTRTHPPAETAEAADASRVATTARTRDRPPGGARPERVLHVVQDRFRLATAESGRVQEALEIALQQGKGHVTVHASFDDGTEHTWNFSNRLHCAHCDLAYKAATPSTFSFNSPIGACEHCRGFGRVMGIDYGLVIPDESLSLHAGAIKPWQSPSYSECQDDLERYAGKAGIRLDVPWQQLSAAEKAWVIDGTPDWKGGSSAWKHQWYGIQRFFDWLETRAYRMHVRVLLSRYRSYSPCPHCDGARLKPAATLWRLGQDTRVIPHHPRFMPSQVGWSPEQLARLPGLGLHDLMILPLAAVRQWFIMLETGTPVDAALQELLDEIRSRLRFLCDVGLGYLSLDRQSRTLSGGEVQRINLTTALGTSLVNTLFVLDEPSIGLHSRDIHRIVQVMHRLRSHGNTLVVVEHDPQVMQAADRILDIGPGPGERGGHILFDGSPAELIQADTLTGRYFSGRLRIEAPRPQAVQAGTARLVLQGVRAHNLKNIDVSLPLGHLVCLTGVSGSGKSTLVQDVLHPALRKYLGQATEAPGAHDALLGAEQIEDVVLVDQSPIGRTTRSNPASYVGAFDAIRKLFAAAEVSRERGYTTGTFSFNTGDGRCPTCSGTGFEHIEMQFLSDVYLRCPDCQGRRYRPEILEVRIEHLGRSAAIDEVLDMTVHQALDFFKGLRDVQWGLAPLADVGLDYLRLGQPVPTLSGGEAQRLKLAGHLAEAARSRPSSTPHKGKLLLFDEPTTGLHFDDIAQLMRAFRKLLAAGHSLLVIEHNLDVIRASDWIVDLGPEGGDQGGRIVAQGSPDQIMHMDTHTAHALVEHEHWRNGQVLELQEPGAQAQAVLASPDIHIVNAREHNLKGIDVHIPRDAFTVITGVSGSGKSTLAFDILFNEGQRRYLESLNAYARAIVQPAGKPDVDAIYGIPPTVAIEQRTSRGGRKSTVATMTEIHHFLRLLYVRLGTQMCPKCHIPVRPQTAEQIVAQIMHDLKHEHIGLLAPLVVARKGYYTDLAKWAAGHGHGHLRVDGAFIATHPWPRLDRYSEHTIELPIRDLLVGADQEGILRAAVQQALTHGHGTIRVLAGLTRSGPGTLAARRAAGLAPDPHELTFSTKRACPGCGTSFPEPDPRLFSYNSRHGWCPACFGTGVELPGFNADQTGEEAAWQTDQAHESQPCRHCHGQRLNPVALAFQWQGRSIAELAALAVDAARPFFAQLELSGRDAEIARDILSEIRARLDFMAEVGLGYLALDRAAPTLSGGETQRIRLAAQLGSNLQGVCYVLDEPTIGLHPHDNRILLDALSRLEGHGNTLVVVEHDEDTIRRADHVIDMGPGAGTRGGRIIAQGTVQEITRHPDSITGRYLRTPLAHPLHGYRPVSPVHESLRIIAASRHNLKHVEARIPLARLVVVTGVSGSGKSTLARDVLLENLGRRLSDPAARWQGCQAIQGWEAIDRVLEVDQTPIGKTPRSCPATYAGFWDDIRKLYASTNEARVRGWTASRFSFNTGAGRCPDCQGQGMRTVEMNFLPDVKIPCETCHGARFNDETLELLWNGSSIGDVLRMEVDDALVHFRAHRRVAHALQLMQDVGLGYLTLGQASPTLSGGEAQRLKLVAELSKARLDDGVLRSGRASRAPRTLYVLDEPSVGLSTADVEKLILVLHRLVDAGHTVMVIEHNLDIMAEADWLIDLGPEGGVEGGRVVAQGDPRAICRENSHTGRILAEFLGPDGA
ncbi:excinuclease ABC subunit UvrA [Castellaniella sp.]|uniref:excinuclease ABC subunit UvrA n=1 Tax=Castellaniella sp. TaxID=1955812 RepID=UPI00355F199E